MFEKFFYRIRVVILSKKKPQNTSKSPVSYSWCWFLIGTFRYCFLTTVNTAHRFWKIMSLSRKPGWAAGPGGRPQLDHYLWCLLGLHLGSVQRGATALGRDSLTAKLNIDHRCHGHARERHRDPEQTLELCAEVCHSSGSFPTGGPGRWGGGGQTASAKAMPSRGPSRHRLGAQREASRGGWGAGCPVTPRPHPSGLHHCAFVHFFLLKTKYIQKIKKYI